MSSGRTPSTVGKKPTTRHPKYNEMVCAAIAELKGRKGSSRQAIAKYVKAHYEVNKNFGVHVNNALKRGVANGSLIQTKGSGATGSFKLNVAKPKKRPTKDSGTLEDEYEDEEASLEDKQQEVGGKGMIQVDLESKWLDKVKKKLQKVTGKTVDKEAWATKEASKATCLVRRTHNSKERIEYHNRLAQDERLDEKDRKDHYRKAKSAEKGVGASGTGMKLVSNPGAKVHFVVTNNHVIMNDEEAESAVVIFDYHIDGDRKNGTKEYKVRFLIDSSPRTTGTGDRDNLDYSVLELEAEGNDPFLLSRGIKECDNKSPHENYDNKDDLKRLPVLMFSHPHGLAMRVSVGMYPDVAKECISHINHNLPSCKGSSGASLLVSADGEFRKWVATFLHYRHGWAVTHRAIYLKEVEEFNKKTGYMRQ